jgi:hypothetical protein
MIKERRHQSIVASEVWLRHPMIETSLTGNYGAAVLIDGVQPLSYEIGAPLAWKAVARSVSKGRSSPYPPPKTSRLGHGGRA